MNVTNRTDKNLGAPSLAEEEALLEKALHDNDRLITDSLREDERRRRRRRTVFLTLFVGGIVMGTAVMAVIAGWLTLAAPPPEAPGAKGDPSAAPAQAPGLSEDLRIEQAEGLARQGWELWQQRKLSEAASLFEQSVALDAENPNAWNGLGWARLNSGDATSATAAFEKCVALEPEHPAGLNGLGQSHLALGNLALAEKFLLKAAPRAPAAYFGLARVYLLTGDFKKAQTWIRKALREQPGDPTLKAMMAAARAGKVPDELRKQIAPVSDDDASPATEAATAGWRQFNEGNFRSAERSFRRALAKDPENGAALNGLGFSLLVAGKAASARPYFEKCLELDPDAAGPLNGLARSLKAEGKVDEAIALWERMHKKYPGPTAATVGLASTFIEREEFGKALPFAEELVKSAPENEEFRRLLEAAKAGTTAPQEESKAKE
jgi:Flp pilus assembly protein TadD